MDIDLNCGANCCHVSNVYIPVDCNNNTDEFINYINTVFKIDQTVFNMTVGDFDSGVLR